MKKPKVLVGLNVPDSVKQYLDTFCDCEYFNLRGIPQLEILRRIKNKKGLLIGGSKIDKQLLDESPELKAVCCASVGYNNVNIEETRRRGIIVTNTPGVLNETVADLILALMLSVSRRIVELDGYLRAGLWKPADNENLFGLDVHHKTLGIIGMGRIGEAVAKRAVGGFSMKVLYHNRNRNSEAEKKLGAVYCEFGQLLSDSDFVLVMTPLTEQTRKMFGRREFSLMKNTAFFINASRGQIVDEAALAEALQNGSIAGAGLDVFDAEPVTSDNPLLKFKNTVLVPHIGSASYQTRGNMAMLAAQNLNEIFKTGNGITEV